MDNRKYIAWRGDNASDLSGSGWLLGPASSAVWPSGSSSHAAARALKSAAAPTVDKSTLDVDLHCVFRCARLCQDACVSACVECYDWTCSLLTSFSRHVRAPIRRHHKVRMLQWPRRLRTVTSYQLWWSPRSCTDMQRWRDSPSNWLFFKQARNVRMGRPSLQAESWKLHAPPTPTPTHPALYDPIFTSLESTCWHSLWCFVFLPTPLWCPSPLYFRLTFTRQNIWQRGKINQYAPINAVKVARKHKQLSESIPGCRGVLRWRPKWSLTLFRTMQSAASVEKGYGVVPIFFLPLLDPVKPGQCSNFQRGAMRMCYCSSRRGLLIQWLRVL